MNVASRSKNVTTRISARSAKMTTKEISDLLDRLFDLAHPGWRDASTSNWPEPNHYWNKHYIRLHNLATKAGFDI